MSQNSDLKLEEIQHRCLNCGNGFQGKYCNLCGEKIVEPQERTVRHFLGELLQAITFADNKLWRTLKLMYTRPGALPRKYVQGLRKPYIAPLALFFIVNLLYFFFQPVDSFNSFYTSQVKYQKYSEWAAHVAERQRMEKGWTDVKFGEQYNLHSANLSKLMLVLLPVMFSLPLLLWFPYRRYYYVDHLAFALNFVAFLLLTLFILLPYLMFVLIAIKNKLTSQNFSLDVNDSTIGLTVAMAAAAYLSIALRNFYKQSWGWIIPKALLLVLSFVIIMMTYRFILFVVTVYTI